MLDLLQEALQYIEKQNQWIFQLKSTIVEKEKSTNEMHMKLTSRIFLELKKANNSDTEQMSGENAVPLAGEEQTIAVKTEKPQDQDDYENGGEGNKFPIQEIYETNEVSNEGTEQYYGGKFSNSQVAALSANIQTNNIGGNDQNYSTNNNIVKSERQDNHETAGQQKEFPTSNNFEPSGVMNCSGYYGGSFSNNQMAASSDDFYSGSTGRSGQNYERDNNIVKSEPQCNHETAGLMSFDLDKTEDRNVGAATASTMMSSFENGGSLLQVKKQFSVAESTKFVKQRFNCPACKKSYAYRNYRKFQEHLRLHTDQKLNCAFCRQEFMELPEVIHHMRNDHCEEPFDCPICEQTFTSKRKYSFHRCFTIAETPFNCDLCNTSFTCWKYYICHNQEHHTDVTGYNFASPTKSFKFKVSWKKK